MKKSLKEAIARETGLKVYGDWIMIDGDLYVLPLVDGNDKIGKGVWHASTLAGSEMVTFEYNDVIYSEKGTCPMTCKNEAGDIACYGLTGCYNYSSTKFYLMKRTQLLRKYPEIYFKLARLQIIHENVKLLRLHATGDFIPGEAAGWHEIFKDMPGLKGWTYTKCRWTADIRKLDNLNNFNIVRSIIPGCGYNFGHIGYILKVYYKLKKAGEKVYICRCGIDKNQHCVNCAGCSENKYVLFIEHSTKYKAMLDSLYETIKAIIEAQPKPILNIINR